MNKIIFVSLICLSIGKEQRFTATWYGDKFQGKKTKSGEIFDKNKMTCASIFFKLGSVLKITNPENGNYIKVRVTDSGAFNVLNIDLSEKAFCKLDQKEKGRIEIIVKQIK